MWDLRGKREVAGLVYGGGTGTFGGPSGYPTGGLAVGGRRGMSDVAWHPDNVRVDSFVPSLILNIVFLGRPLGWLPLPKTICPLSSWFGTCAMPVLQRES